MSDHGAVATATRRRLPPSPPHASGDRLRGVVRGFGELLITLGMVVLLFVGYELYVTTWLNAGEQADATAALEDQWRNPRGTIDRPIEGNGIARLHIPTFGSDFAVIVVQGTGKDALATGPGHYVDTPMPGQPGNFAVAGHRVGKGAPFNDLDLLASCDALVVETRDTWFVYRVLPLEGEAAGWAAGKGAQERCRGVAPPSGPYADVVGQQIVLPWQGEVKASVPGARDAQLPPEQLETLITLTTCHPQFSARQRLIVHGVLVAQHPKGGQRPAELIRG